MFNFTSSYSSELIYIYVHDIDFICILYMYISTRDSKMVFP